MTYEEAYTALKRKEKGFVATRVISYKDLFMFADKNTMSSEYDNWIRTVNKNTGEISVFYITPSNIEEVLSGSEVVKVF